MVYCGTIDNISPINSYTNKKLLKSKFKMIIQ